MIRLLLVGLMLASVLAGCSGQQPLRQKNLPDYMVQGYNPESNVGLVYYFQRSYILKRHGEEFKVVEYIKYDSEIYLPADTVGFTFTMKVSNPKETYINVWRYLEKEVYGPITLVERATQYMLIYEGRLPTRSYQMALPVEENQRYKFFIELKKGGDELSTILKTFNLTYRKEK